MYLCYTQKVMPTLPKEGGAKELICELSQIKHFFTLRKLPETQLLTSIQSLKQFQKTRPNQSHKLKVTIIDIKTNMVIITIKHVRPLYSSSNFHHDINIEWNILTNINQNGNALITYVLFALKEDLRLHIDLSCYVSMKRILCLLIYVSLCRFISTTIDIFSLNNFGRSPPSIFFLLMLK